MTQPRIFICDDEPDLREMVGEYLAGRGFETDIYADGPALLAAANLLAPSLCILDLNMPEMDGMTVLRHLRNQQDVPVIMLTASAETVDRIVGLEMGADDYIGKPVDLRELEARVKSVLRRSQASGAESHSSQGNTRVAFGRCELDIDGGRLFGPDGEEIPITAMEFALVRTFVANKGRVLNRDQLLDMAHGRDWDPFDRSIDLRISRLRRKIEVNPKTPETIRTVRGLGYVHD